MPKHNSYRPEGFHTLTPHITVKDADRALDFYKSAFGAEIANVHRTAEGTVMHAVVIIGDSVMALNEEFPQYGVLSPLSQGPSSIYLHIYCDDVDSWFDRAVAAGAKVTMPLRDQFWGDRYGQLQDPFGHKWSIATRIKQMTDEEMDEAGRTAMTEMKKER